MMTLTLNPCIDKTIEVDKLTPYGLNRAEKTRTDIGGKGINVSKVLKNSNENIKTCAILGENNSDIFLKYFEKNDFKSFICMAKGESRTNLKIVDKSCKKTTELNESGFFVDKNTLNSFLKCFEKALEISKILILSGSIPKGIDNNIYKLLIETARKRSIISVLDADGSCFKNGIEAKPYAIKPNLYELETYFGKNIKSKNDIITHSLKLIDKGIKIVLVSLGEDGAIITDKNESYYAKPFPCNVQSTVGAGDSMTAILSWCIVNNNSLKDTLQLAITAGTLTACKKGTQLCEFDEIFLNKDKVNVYKIR